jgi:drug/metabolite transporter (DMT)-like permease
MHLLPAFAASLASLLFGEAYRAHHAVGIGVLLLGVRVVGGGRRPA